MSGRERKRDCWRLGLRENQKRKGERQRVMRKRERACIWGIKQMIFDFNV